MDKEIAGDMHRLDFLFGEVSKVQDDEMRAHWSRYLCVLTSGFIENALRILIMRYVSAKAHPNVANYVGSGIKQITNLNERRLKELLGSFCQDWRRVFEESVTDEQKAAVDSVIANRHNIVHGRLVGVTYVRVKAYYEDVKEVVKVIDDKCLNACRQ